MKFVSCILFGLATASIVFGTRAPTPSASVRSDPDTLTVVSLNMAKQRDLSTIMNDFRAAPRVRQADVLLLQEVANSGDQSSVADQLAHQLGYFVFFAPASLTTFDQGLAILSRYPLADQGVLRLKTYNLRFHSRQRFAISATMLTPSCPVKIWNTHLDTRLNAEQRLEQLQPVVNDAVRYPGARLIDGDFNTNELAWLANLVPVISTRAHGQLIREEMKRHGFTTPFPDGLVTFPMFHRHLDWIYSSGFQVLDSGAEPMPFSDHNAISARFRLAK